jgi:nitrate/nitrite transporter NarK
MFVGSFIIQYFLMSAITTSSTEYITNSLGKAYLSLAMASCMVILEVMMHDHQYGVFSLKYYTIFGGLIGFSVFLYRKQKYVTDKEYLKEMTEHHSMALLTSKRILEKTNDYEVAKLAKGIIQKQEDEIREMKQVLAKR